MTVSGRKAESMTADDVVTWMRSRGKPNTVRIYRRHGVTDETVGLSYADLDVLTRRLRTDHTLALALWRTGLHDARVLAARIADPTAMTSRQIESWLGDCTDHVVTAAVAGLAARLPAAAELARAWIDAPGEFAAAAGWNVLSILATLGALTPAAADPLLRRIGRDIHGAPNRTRHSMNNALIAMGGAMPEVRPLALETAREIGVVEVDHGRTGCKTPDAAAYIRRMAERPPRRVRPPAGAARG